MVAIYYMHTDRSFVSQSLVEALAAGPTLWLLCDCDSADVYPSFCNEVHFVERNPAPVGRLLSD